jgi:hypothetical protein
MLEFTGYDPRKPENVTVEGVGVGVVDGGCFLEVLKRPIALIEAGELA